MNEYVIELPKLQVLEYAEILSVIVTIIFIFVALIAMLISGILINGILKTSVEERIREFGIFRTLGAHKSYNLYIVILQGFLLCNVGSILGIFSGFFGTQLLVFIANKFILSTIPALGGAELIFSFTWVSLIIAYSIGVTVGIIVSISPAIKVMRLQIIESIHPYRHEDTLYHLQKKSTINYKLILTGIILSLNGGFVYLVVPRILISSDMTLFAGVLIVVLLIFLIGVTLAGLGIIPVILRFIIVIFKPISKRLHQVISIFVHRYQRRNTSTIIIFALSFSFVMFTSIVVNGLSSQVLDRAYLQYGSDLVIETKGWAEEPISFQDYFQGEFGGEGMFTTLGNNDPPKLASNDGYDINPDRIMTMDFKDNLLMYQGIEKVSSALANPFQLGQIYLGSGEDFITELGDYAGLSSQEITLIPIDEEFSYTINDQYMSFTQGNLNEVFNNIFTNNEYKCIISEAIASDMNLNLGDLIRIIVHRGDELEIFPFKIAGVAATIPGFSDFFQRSARGAENGGVILSQENYIKIMEIPTNSYVNKFFIKLREDTNVNIGSLIERIKENYELNYDFDIANLRSIIRGRQITFSILDTFFNLVLVSTIIICLFGLLSSSYSTIIERKKEIGIIRTLGLRGKEINKLFIIEALIIMLSSATVGVLVGSATGWLLNYSLSQLSNMPFQLFIPINNLILVYLLSIVFVYVGMKLLLWKARKKKIVEIYRETV
ncbi:MAG: FtsX-like permease family protein [Candidatus Lokiarchaeota archaeon]